MDSAVDSCIVNDRNVCYTCSKYNGFSSAAEVYPEFGRNNPFCFNAMPSSPDYSTSFVADDSERLFGAGNEMHADIDSSVRTGPHSNFAGVHQDEQLDQGTVKPLFESDGVYE